MRRRGLLALLASGLVARRVDLAGAGAGPVLTVFGASDLAFAFADLVPAYERARGVTVTLVLGSTGNLARQIEQGAPADVFFAAEAQVVDALLTRGVLAPGSGVRYARGQLILATARAGGLGALGLPDLAGPRVRHVALANPRHAPYGRAAEEALRASGLWEAVRAKLVYGEHVRQALQFVQTGAAEAGLVARSLAAAPDITWTLVPSTLHAPLDQAAAVVARSVYHEQGRDFLRFVTGPIGRPVLARHGFLQPGEP